METPGPVYIPLDPVRAREVAEEEIRMRVRKTCENMPMSLRALISEEIRSLTRPMIRELLDPQTIRELAREAILSFLESREGWVARVLTRNIRDVRRQCALCHKRIKSDPHSGGYPIDPLISTPQGAMHTSCYEQARADAVQARANAAQATEETTP